MQIDVSNLTPKERQVIAAWQEASCAYSEELGRPLDFHAEGMILLFGIVEEHYSGDDFAEVACKLGMFAYQALILAKRLPEGHC